MCTCINDLPTWLLTFIYEILNIELKPKLYAILNMYHSLAELVRLLPHNLLLLCGVYMKGMCGGTEANHLVRLSSKVFKDIDAMMSWRTLFIIFKGMELFLVKSPKTFYNGLFYIFKIGERWLKWSTWCSEF